ncbi:ATP synthase subunit d, mitochondrial-like isoform X2 [Daktulosphaira vitifoliae]|uniref:ATP synthase subunit d, mitochondrial-like isoform X1 n=1 Tax=Daktulosphaira vitifoliae TaxID=58002 RepID=UPI0021A9A593|nr:ATP synthase subunit d, mitochondrial-like isoform X1 [Daktulosphaira vitifoliae]XP_050522110.1 ATP synthase subunit d, mitochondrial-like isoform X2 [Daktulosphaira vitifoliae]
MYLTSHKKKGQEDKKKLKLIINLFIPHNKIYAKSDPPSTQLYLYEKYNIYLFKSIAENIKMQEIEEFKKVAASNIKVAELRIEEIKNLLPYSQMTYEDAAYIEPDLTLDLENKPSFWPHQEIDYVFDEPQEEGSGRQKKA